jgi:TolB-like protein
MSQQHFAFGPFIFDMQRGSLTRAGRHIAVGHKGLLLLEALLRAPGMVISKADLMQAAWPDTAVEESNLSVQIAALRKLLGPQADGSEWIATVPRVGYRFLGQVEKDVEQLRPIQTAGIERRPSIIVLPFTNLSGDKEQDYLVDGITEDIITTLTRFRWFRVIGRNASFAHRSSDTGKAARELGVGYALEGSVRKSGQHVRISAQLIDAASAGHIWAERYELELTEAFAIQDAIAERVAGAIEPELLKTEALPTGARHSGNVTAWDLVHQGQWQFHHVGRDTHLKARELFRSARALDPELVEAHIWLARVNAGIVAYGWSDQPSEDIREGLDAAINAIRLDEKHPYSHYALAICSPYADAPEQAILAAEKAIELNSSFALGHLVLGMAQLFRGNATHAIASLERGLTLNAHDPQNFVWYNLLALAYLFAGKPEQGLAAAVKGRKVRPNWRPTFEALACCFAALDRWQEARQYIEKAHLLEKPPGDALAPLRQRNSKWVAQIEDLLTKASR